MRRSAAGDRSELSPSDGSERALPGGGTVPPPGAWAGEAVATAIRTIAASARCTCTNTRFDLKMSEQVNEVKGSHLWGRKKDAGKPLMMLHPCKGSVST